MLLIQLLIRGVFGRMVRLGAVWLPNLGATLGRPLVVLGHLWARCGASSGVSHVWSFSRKAKITATAHKNTNPPGIFPQNPAYAEILESLEMMSGTDAQTKPTHAPGAGVT